MSAFWFGNKKIYDGFFFSEKRSKRMISCKTSELLCDIVRKYIRSALLTSRSLTPPPTITCSHSTWVPMLCAPLREDVINYNKIYFFMCCVDVWRKWFECSKLRLQPFFSFCAKWCTNISSREYEGQKWARRSFKWPLNASNQALSTFNSHKENKKQRRWTGNLFYPRNKSNQLMLII